MFNLFCDSSFGFLNLYKLILVFILNKRVISCDEGILRVKNIIFLVGLLFEVDVVFLVIFKVKVVFFIFGLVVKIIILLG